MGWRNKFNFPRAFSNIKNSNNLKIFLISFSGPNLMRKSHLGPNLPFLSILSKTSTLKILLFLYFFASASQLFRKLLAIQKMNYRINIPFQLNNIYSIRKKNDDQSNRSAVRNTVNRHNI